MRFFILPLIITAICTTTALADAAKLAGHDVGRSGGLAVIAGDGADAHAVKLAANGRWLVRILAKDDATAAKLTAATEKLLPLKVNSDRPDTRIDAVGVPPCSPAPPSRPAMRSSSWSMSIRCRAATGCGTTHPGPIVPQSAHRLTTARANVLGARHRGVQGRQMSCDATSLV